MSEQTEFNPSGQITVKIDHSLVEERERERAEKAEKALIEAQTEIERLKENAPKPTGSVPLNENQYRSRQATEGRQGFKDYAEMSKFMVQNSNKDSTVKQQYDALFLRSLNSMQGETFVLDSSLADLANGRGRWKLGKNQESRGNFND